MTTEQEYLDFLAEEAKRVHEEAEEQQKYFELYADLLRRTLTYDGDYNK